MKKTISLLSFCLSVIICSGCSSDDINHPILGEWQLVTWSVGISLDINNDRVFSDNILDETACEVKETLRFDADGIVTSKDSFNPEITISLNDDTSDTYNVKEICAEGVIGFSTDYEHGNDQTVVFNQAIGTLTNKKLIVVYKNAIKIYNRALNTVVETRDLTLIYEKR